VRFVGREKKEEEKRTSRSRQKRWRCSKEEVDECDSLSTQV